MAKFRAEGNVLDIVPVTAVAAGTVVQQGAFAGIANNDIPANTKGSIAISGTFEAPVGSPVTNTVGTVVAFRLATQDLAPSGGGDFDVVITENVTTLIKRVQFRNQV